MPKPLSAALFQSQLKEVRQQLRKEKEQRQAKIKTLEQREADLLHTYNITEAYKALDTPGNKKAAMHQQELYREKYQRQDEKENSHPQKK